MTENPIWNNSFDQMQRWKSTSETQGVKGLINNIIVYKLNIFSHDILSVMIFIPIEIFIL